MFYSPRKTLLEDVVAVPSTATTSSVVISSDELYPYEQSSFGSVTAFVKALDGSKITVASPALTGYVSYDEGDTWVEVDSVDLTATSFTFDYSLEASLVPRFKVELDLNGATLLEGHGIQVDVYFTETQVNTRRTLFEDVIVVPSTVADGVTTTGDSLEVPEGTSAIHVVATGDVTTLTGVTILAQSSWDGSNWWNLGTATNFSGSNFVDFTEDENIVGNYARVNLITAASTGEIAVDHGIVVNAFALGA